jgi:hypothetical protein
MSAAAMANWAAGRSGVGPGVNKRVFRIMKISSFSAGAEKESGRDSADSASLWRWVSHRIHNFVVYVIFIFCGNLHSSQNGQRSNFAAS